MAENKEKGWSLKGCKDDSDVRNRCRDMFIGDLRELQAKLEDAIHNGLLYANHSDFRKALGIVTEVLEAREAQNYNQ